MGITQKQINVALRATFAGKNIEFVKGEGYCYFFGDDVEFCNTTSVMVPYVNDLSLDQWLAEAETFLVENAKYVSERRMIDSEPRRMIIRSAAPVQPNLMHQTPAEPNIAEGSIVEMSPPHIAPTEPVQPKRIDLTPTWVAIMPVIIAALQDGTEVGRKSAREELMRVAAILDAYNDQKEAPAIAAI